MDAGSAVRWLVLLASAAVALHCTARLAATALPRRRSAWPGNPATAGSVGVSLPLSHLVMAVGMVAMLFPAVNPLPVVVVAGGYLGYGAWFVVRSHRGRDPADLHQAVSLFAMAVMTGSMLPGAGVAGTAGAGMRMAPAAVSPWFLISLVVRVLTVGLLCYYVVLVGWTVAGVAVAARPRPALAGPGLLARPATLRLVASPTVASACRLLMAVAMLSMLAVRL